MYSISKYWIFIVFISLPALVACGQELTNKLAWTVKYGQTENLKHLIAADRINECVGVAGGKNIVIWQSASN